MSGCLDDPPGMVVRADVTSPGERLVGDPDAEVLGEVGESGELSGGEGVVVHGEGETLEQTRTVSAPSRFITANLARARRRLRANSSAGTASMSRIGW